MVRDLLYIPEPLIIKASLPQSGPAEENNKLPQKIALSTTNNRRTVRIAAIVQCCGAMNGPAGCQQSCSVGIESMTKCWGASQNSAKICSNQTLGCQQNGVMM